MLLEFTTKGIYCEKGNFYIDPSGAVDYALVTHGHSDHARKGSKHYLAHKDTAAILKLRLGANINVQTIEFGKEININGVKVTYFPSGHVVGASQIRVTNGIETWIVSGDYKLEDDGISTPFEHIKATHFVTESTFAKPYFNWQPQSEIYNEINNWWKTNRENGITSVLFAYSLGKSQRILKNIDSAIGNIAVHKTIDETNNVIKQLGRSLPDTLLLETAKSAELKGSLIIAPSLKSIEPFVKGKRLSYAQASGWMQMEWFKPKYIDKGFVISDHADWNGLQKAIKETGAQNIYIMHGYTTYFAKYLNSNGFNAKAVTPKNLNQLNLI